MLADISLNVSSADEKAYGENIFCTLLDNRDGYTQASQAEMERANEISWESRANAIKTFISSLPSPVI